MLMMNQNWSQSAKERRLVFKDDMKQLYHDTKGRHLVRIMHPVEDPIAALGAVPMSIAAGVTKFGNSVAGLLSDAPAVPLKDGGLAYLSRDFTSVRLNTVAAAKNLVPHPIKAAGNLIKVGFDVADLPFDVALDVGSGIFGHHHNATRSSIQRTLAV